jgi:transposase
MKRSKKSKPIADRGCAEQQATAATQLPNTQPQILVGIDWADGEHAYHMRAPDGSFRWGSVAQTAEAIADLLNEWKNDFPDAQLSICLETSRGALINALLEHPSITVYPVNPNALANYRKAFAHGGGKTDPVDAKLILQYLQHYRDQLRPLLPNSPLTRELAALAEDRRRLVEQRVALANELKSLLKTYFPAILLLNPAKIYAEFIVRLLRKYPTLQAAQTAGRAKLRKFFFGVGAKDKVEQRLDTLRDAVPLSTDEVLLRTSARRTQAICGQLDSLNQSISQYDDELKQLVKTHADYEIVRSLPGTAEKTQARLIAALGDDRSRYQSAESLQAAAGIAPLTTQSGKQRFVSSRWACSKFIKQTFHEYAGLSITKSVWAKAYYEQQLARGSSKQMARRALAYKWLRIIYRCWQTREPYDEARYLARLAATKSPFAALIAASS